MDSVVELFKEGYQYFNQDDVSFAKSICVIYAAIYTYLNGFEIGM